MSKQMFFKQEAYIHKGTTPETFRLSFNALGKNICLQHFALTSEANTWTKILLQVLIGGMPFTIHEFSGGKLSTDPILLNNIFIPGDSQLQVVITGGAITNIWTLTVFGYFADAL